MNILAIETSCDETAVAVIEAESGLRGAEYRVLGNALYSQAALHAEYGGVYPNLAKREHQKNLVPLTKKALGDANLLLNYSSKEGYASGNTTIYGSAVERIREEEFRNDVAKFLKTHAKPDINLIAVTSGPGLEPALWTGISFAEALGMAWNIPVVGINHMEGHLVSGLLTREGTGSRLQVTGSPESEPVTYNLQPATFPVLALLISGGHTELVVMKDWFKYELVGRTRDDAVGEAFDKVARILGFPYPGGPEIDRAAKRAREGGRTNDVSLPRPMLKDESCDFSFSGLKTAALYMVRDLGELSEETKGNIAQEFEDAVRDVLVSKTKRALEKTGANTLVVGGGVSANAFIREGLEAMVRSSFSGTTLHYPEKTLTGDNAVMIGIAAHLRHAGGAIKTGAPLKAHGSLSLA